MPKRLIRDAHDLIVRALPSAKGKLRIVLMVLLVGLAGLQHLVDDSPGATPDPEMDRCKVEPFLAECEFDFDMVDYLVNFQ